jgi:hypothetical protein
VSKEEPLKGEDWGEDEKNVFSIDYIPLLPRAGKMY